MLRRDFRSKLIQCLARLLHAQVVKTARHERPQGLGQLQGLGANASHPKLAPSREDPQAKAEHAERRLNALVVGDKKLFAFGLELAQIVIGEGFLLHDSSRKVKSNAPAGMPISKPAARTIRICAVSAPHGSTAAGGLAPGLVRVGRFRSQLRGLS